MPCDPCRFCYGLGGGYYCIAYQGSLQFWNVYLLLESQYSCMSQRLDAWIGLRDWRGFLAEIKNYQD